MENNKPKTKKASAPVLAYIKKLNPESKSTTIYDVWMEMAQLGKLYGDLNTEVTKNRKKTTFTILDDVDEQKPIHTIEWDNDDVFDVNVGDWKWDRLFKDIVEYLMKTRLVKTRMTAFEKEAKKQAKKQSKTQTKTKTQTKYKTQKK